MRRRTGKHASGETALTHAFPRLLLATGLIFTSLISPAQSGNAPDPASPAPHDYRFEVAAIRSRPDSSLSHAPGPSYTPGRFRQEVTSIPGLAFIAFEKTQGFEIESQPWMNSTYFSVDATLPEGATKADLPVMVRHLLEDRFGLKYHHVSRQEAGYELVVAKSGAKVEKQDGPTSDSLGGFGSFDVKDGVPQFPKDARSSIGCAGAGCWFHGHNRTMQTLAADLARQLRAPVANRTGLEGGYDYSVIYTPEPYGPEPTGGGASEPSKFPMLRDAVREQLGLELRPVKNVPLDVVVLDSATKEPTEN